MRECYIVSTNTSAALWYLRTNVFTSARTGVSRIAIVITNGNSVDATATQEQADLTRRAGISIMAVAVGNWLDINELRRVVSYPSERNTLRIANYESFGDVVHTLKSSVCGSEYALQCSAADCSVSALFALMLVLETVSNCSVSYTHLTLPTKRIV